jgi:acyl-CoA thioester hydrolase
MSNTGPESTVPPAASGGDACIGRQPVAGADAGQGRAKPPFKFSAKTRVGFSDTDAQGIVYYGRYNPYFDLARVEYLRDLNLLHRHGDDEFGQFVMRANTVEYFAPAVFDDEIEVFVRVARIGKTSVTFEFAAYREPDDVLMVTAQQTLVHVDLTERRAHPVPESYREPIYAFEGEDCVR